MDFSEAVISEKGGYFVKKGLFLVLPITLMLPAAVRAEIVGHTSDGAYIHAYAAPNGQMIYFTALESEPNIIMRDVNFDGQEDLIVMTSMGASNFFCEFFVFDNGQYVQAEHNGLGGSLCNYELYPESGIVGSHANNGYAGALHEYYLFRWEGTNLRLIRRGSSEELTETEFGDEAYTVTTHRNRLHIVIRDYSAGDYEGTMLWDNVVELDEMDAAMFDQEQELLWQGLR